MFSNTLKTSLSLENKRFLSNYFKTISRLPKRKEKLEISTKLDVNPLIINKWFQTQRNREKYDQQQDERKLKKKNVVTLATI
jgi:hypothetical protein